MKEACVVTYIYPPFIIYSPYICVPALHTRQHNSHPRLSERTPFAPIHFSNSKGALGIEAWLRVFPKNKVIPYTSKHPQVNVGSLFGLFWISFLPTSSNAFKL